MNEAVADAQGQGWRARTAELATGLATSAAINWAFDWLLYPYAIFKLGLVWGGVAMSVASFLSCILVLWLYDLLKRDWLGIEAIKRLRDTDGQTRLRGLLSRMLRRSNAVAFLVLSIQFDPFITVAYLRHGRFDGLSRRDWRIFLGSWAVGNGSWIMACFLGVSALTWLWQFVH